MTMPSASTYRPRGTLFVLSGPSGVGKDTVLRQAVARLGNIRTSISVTTRKPRRGEKHGLNYFFVSPETFAEKLARDEFLEHARVHNNSYGTPRTWVEAQLDAGVDVVLEIDVQGALQVKTRFPDLVLVFLAPPSWAELARRLRHRETEDEATIQRRLTNAREELLQAGDYHYLVINDKLTDAIDRFCAIVIAERCRPRRQDLRALLEEGRDG